MPNWFEQGDNYCERTDLTFWAEPLNAITNLAFIFAAYILFRRLHGSNLIGGYILTAVLALIGIGSFLFHTFATNWAALSDVAPIGIFIIVYLFLVNRHMLELPLWESLLLTGAFVPFSAFFYPLFNSLPFFEISNFYWVVPLLLLLYTPSVFRKNPNTAKGMVIGAVILCVSIALRSIDLPMCETWPIGTHIFWHIFNGIMLGWMIEVYRRHMVAHGTGYG